MYVFLYVRPQNLLIFSSKLTALSSIQDNSAQKHFSSTVKLFDRNNFMVDMDTFVAGRIDKLVNNIITSENHILNDCYSCPRTQNLLPIVRKNRL
mgnify:FL=1